MIDLKPLLELAIRASEEACKEIIAVYNSSDFQTEIKRDSSPLTLADKKSHQRIESMLKSTQIPILSEEGKATPYEERRHWEYLWLVDPLDGTKEFLKRNGEFTVNIALIHKQISVLGVVAVPVTGEVYYGAMGQGAFLKQGNSMRRLEHRKTVDLKQTGLRVVASRSHLNEETQDFINGLTGAQLVSTGSSLKFMLLAEGKADVYPRFAPTMEWDTAAAHAVLAEVRVQVNQKDNQLPLAYNKADLLNPHFLCY